jgi:hypothetical protein
MTSQEAWQVIVLKLIDNQLELPTVPKIKKNPVWFTASTDGDVIFIDTAINHHPSSQITTRRTLTYSNFQKVYPLYLRREKCEPISKEVSAVTVNQVYYFSLIKHLIK